MLSQEFDEKVQIEYLVVDNNSSDATRSVVESYMHKHPQFKLKYVLEPKQGCNYARNTGIEQASGEYLVFFDDDVIVEQGTIAAYLKAFERYPDDLVFGGKILLAPPDFSLPAWLVTEGPYWRTNIVLIRTYGDIFKRIELPDPCPVTVNMAVHRKAFETCGMFRTEFGFSGKQLLPGADYELFVRFARTIKNWIYVPGATAYHPLKKGQASKSYFRKRLFGVGRVTYRLQNFKAKFRICGLPFYFITFIIRNTLKSLFYLFLNKPVEQFYYETEAILNCGCVYEHFAQRRAAQKRTVT